jgi:hypothetical protein
MLVCAMRWRNVRSGIKTLEAAHAIVSKIGGNQIIGTSASANIEPRRGGTYQITVGIERFQIARLIGPNIRLNSPQCTFFYKE